MAKLTWMNAEYIRRLDPGAFTSYAEPYYEKAGIERMDREIPVSYTHLDVYKRQVEDMPYTSAIEVWFTVSSGAPYAYRVPSFKSAILSQ